MEAPIKHQMTSNHKDRGAEVPETFPIIGLGASAGGLDALKRFFSEVSETSGMAYVVVVHIPSDSPSMMPELLQKKTSIPVSTAEDGQLIAPDHVYVVPPDKEIGVFKGRLQLLDRMKKTGGLPIDGFLRSLAQDQGDRAAAVILSGTGTDGTQGAREIKANDGLLLAQTGESAGYDGMPRSVINTGLVDVALPPEKMPEKLVQFFTHPASAPDKKKVEEAGGRKEWLNKVFALLRAKTGNDFSSYKANTTLRRIGRRMGLNGIGDHDMYIRFMRENPAEVDALFRDLLIGVTRFFRDADSFDALKEKALPSVFDGMTEDAAFRAWIPGCSTGEEVYSLAMTLRESLDSAPKRFGPQLFGTDIDGFAIDKAREGLYPASVAADVSPERLKRFFTKEGDSFRIRKVIRDSVVFSVQNLLKDPPFSRLNLLCCRNLLIYLNADAQKKLLPLFHYTLAPGGVLMLSSSESIGGFTDLFEVVDKKWKIYRRREDPQALRRHVAFPSGSPAGASYREPAPAAPVNRKASDIACSTQKTLLDEFAPAAVLVDAGGEMLYVQGRTGKYLETPGGPPSRNILDFAREGLRIELSSALRSAKSANHRVTRRRVAVKTNGGVQTIDLHVCPRTEPKALAGRFLVVFEDVEAPSPDLSAEKGDGSESGPGSSRIDELEKELQFTRESHQSTVEELETSNEELKSTNEELQSANEELQSTNEELESSKEELQSLNEELQTVNAELQSKIEELSATHDDMRNLLNSTEIATIFVDNDLRVRRFTPEATALVNLIPSDTGRPLRHVATNLSYDGMIADLKEVLRERTPREIELQTTEGEWYNMRIMPYHTTDNRIDGAVLTFANIDDQKKAQESIKASKREVEGAWGLMRALFDMNPDPMAVLDEDGKVVIANTALSGRMAIDQKEIEGTDLLGTSKVFNAVQSAELKAALEDGRDFTPRGFEMNTPEGEERFTVAGRIMRNDENVPYRILLRFTAEGPKET